MERYNIFYQIHKGLRSMLYETAIQLLQTDFHVKDEAEEATALLTQVVALFEKHAESEDGFILHPLEALEPAVSELFEKDHEKDHLLGNKIKSLLDMLRHAEADEERKVIGSAIRLAYTEFLVFNLEHMAREESQLNSYLWDYYSDEELHGITGQIIAHIPQDYQVRFNRIMLRGLSNDEITAWMNAVKATAPDFVYEGLQKLAEKELPDYRFRTIMNNLKADAIRA